jgi:hypothetical protein
MTERKQIVVVDVPAGITASEAEQLLNDACQPGYYLRAVTPLANGDSRAFFALRIQPEQKEHRPLSNIDGKEDEALAIIRAHSDDSIFSIVQRLQAVGIKRGKNWVSWKRQEMLGGKGAKFTSE